MAEAEHAAAGLGRLPELPEGGGIWRKSLPIVDRAEVDAFAYILISRLPPLAIGSFGANYSPDERPPAAAALVAALPVGVTYPNRGLARDRGGTDRDH